MIGRLLRSTAMSLALSFFQLPVVDVFVYAQGVERPSWVAQACCSPQDAHKLRADQVYMDQFGDWRIEGYPWAVPKDSVNPNGVSSQDGSYWAFYCGPETKGAICTPGQFSKIWCFFTPLAF